MRRACTQVVNFRERDLWSIYRIGAVQINIACPSRGLEAVLD